MSESNLREQELRFKITHVNSTLKVCAQALGPDVVFSGVINWMLDGTPHMTKEEFDGFVQGVVAALNQGRTQQTLHKSAVILTPGKMN